MSEQTKPAKRATCGCRDREDIPHAIEEVERLRAENARYVEDLILWQQRESKAIKENYKAREKNAALEAELGTQRARADRMELDMHKAEAQVRELQQVRDSLQSENDRMRANFERLGKAAEAFREALK